MSSHPLYRQYHMHSWYDITLAKYVASFPLCKTSHPHFMTSDHRVYVITAAIFDAQLDSWVGKICWRRDRLPTPVFLGFPCGSFGKESTCNAGDLLSIPGLGISPGEGKGYPLQYSGLDSSVVCIVHGVTKSLT